MLLWPLLPPSSRRTLFLIPEADILLRDLPCVNWPCFAVLGHMSLCPRVGSPLDILCPPLPPVPTSLQESCPAQPQQGLSIPAICHLPSPPCPRRADPSFNSAHLGLSWDTPDLRCPPQRPRSSHACPVSSRSLPRGRNISLGPQQGGPLTCPGCGLVSSAWCS